MALSPKGDLYIQAAEKGFAEKLSGEMYEVKVPEMDIGEGDSKEEAVLHFKPSTLAERDVIYRAVQDGGLGSLIEIIIVRARDEEGNKLFAKKHKIFFERKIDPDVINRIVADLAELEGLDIEDTPKK